MWQPEAGGTFQRKKAKRENNNRRQDSTDVQGSHTQTPQNFTGEALWAFGTNFYSPGAKSSSVTLCNKGSQALKFFTCRNNKVTNRWRLTQKLDMRHLHLSLFHFAFMKLVCTQSKEMLMQCSQGQVHHFKKLFTGV